MNVPLASSWYVSSEEEDKLGPGTGKVSTELHGDTDQEMEGSSSTEQLDGLQASLEASGKEQEQLPIVSEDEEVESTPPTWSKDAQGREARGTMLVGQVTCKEAASSIMRGPTDVTY